MKINRFEEVIGVLPQANVVEGRFGLLTANATPSYNYGSSTLPGFKVPATADEAEQARFVITWAVTNQKPPFYLNMPNFNSEITMRMGGFEHAEQFPASNVTVYETWPGMQDSRTIPEDTPSLAYGVGTYTIPSGQYIYDANLRNAGACVIVANTAEDTTDAGKPKYQATNDARVIGTVEYYDASTGDLTIRVK